MILEGIKLLLISDTPVWAKVLVGVLFLGAIVAWWIEPYWHNLVKPDKQITPRKARPPF